MDPKTLIVSMTSWPKRIQFVAKAFASILMGNTPRNLYHCVLVLAETEFPNREADLPKDLQKMILCNEIEVIWHPINIFSHKKLMPVLAKYPDNPILVMDDDIIRPLGWLDTFIKDHIAHPSDVIVGGCVFDIGFDENGFNPIKRFGFDTPESAGKIITNRRPANGFGGVLYPAHIFKSPEFYDEKLFMELSRFSDESWQWAFNMMEGHTLRMLSKHFDHQCGQQSGTYDCSMTKMRDKADSYRNIYNRIIAKFPILDKIVREKFNA